MIRKSMSFLRRFKNDEDGNMVVEFAIGVPLIFTMFMTSVEMGIYTMRQMFLDRGVDMTVRNIRLNTGAATDHTDLKNMVCNFAGFLEDCDTTLRLSMNPIDVRTFNGNDGPTDCVDVSEPLTPLLSFVHGGEHEMMLIRACYPFKPVFPTSGLGYALEKDGSGRAQMFAFSAFVQEPS